MSTRKNRNKKHNPHKRHANYARSLLKRLNAVVVWVAGQNDNCVRLVSLKDGTEIPVMPALQRAIADVQHDWSIYCGVFGRRQDGEEYMKSEIVIAPRCFQGQIADQLSEIHTALLRGMNPIHRVGLGWIACPWGSDISESKAGWLFDKPGGWDADSADIEGEAA